MKCYDLLTDPATLEAHIRLGWDGILAACEFGADFRGFAESARKRGRNVLVGAIISEAPEKAAHKALDLGADLVVVDGRNEDAARAASESWEVDLIVNPEMNEERDLVDQWSGGIDHVMAAFMAERRVGYLVNAGNVLHANGMRRARLLGRIGQNIRVARKYGVNVVLGCGARTDLDVRSPHDLADGGMMLGLTEAQSKAAVGKNTEEYAGRAKDRSDPDVILRGLTVKSWGTQQRRQKRKYGWY
ncbi:MAG: RNase P subunit p30 family protein [Candidatus Altiarchaeota archaeon]